MVFINNSIIKEAANTQLQIKRGTVLNEVLKQERFSGTDRNGRCACSCAARAIRRWWGIRWMETPILSATFIPGKGAWWAMAAMRRHVSWK